MANTTNNATRDAIRKAGEELKVLDLVQYYTNGKAFIPVDIKRDWFRMVYPDGDIRVDSIELTPERTPDTYVCKVSVYNGDRHIADGVAKSTGAIIDGECVSGYTLASRAALNNALRNAGFDMPIELEQKTKMKQTTGSEIKAEIYVDDESKAAIEAKAKAEAEAQAKAEEEAKAKAEAEAKAKAEAEAQAKAEEEAKAKAEAEAQAKAEEEAKAKAEAEAKTKAEAEAQAKAEEEAQAKAEEEAKAKAEAEAKAKAEEEAKAKAEAEAKTDKIDPNEIDWAAVKAKAEAQPIEDAADASLINTLDDARALMYKNVRGVSGIMWELEQRAGESLEAKTFLNWAATSGAHLLSEPEYKAAGMAKASQVILANRPDLVIARQ